MDLAVGRGPLNASETAELGARRTLYTAGACKLYQDSFVPDEGSVVGDFAAAEADFAGYAEGLVTMQPVSPDADGGYVTISDAQFFQATDAVTPNAIGGCWFETAAGVLLSYYPFPTAIAMAEALNYINLLLLLRSPGEDEVRVNS